VSCECSWQAKWSLRTERYKFILARTPDLYGTPDRELYDLAADPGETSNLVEREPERAAAMEQALENWIAEQLALVGRSEDPLREQGVGVTLD